uniref:Uncharacterized protein n=1 Tax=Romanomermis culicivorax TaxID=13658 RepID=A0A915J175_ROMCU
MGWVVITDFGCQGTVVIVVNARALIAGIGGTMVEETNVKAMAGNDVIVIVVVAGFGMGHRGNDLGCDCLGWQCLGDGNSSFFGDGSRQADATHDEISGYWNGVPVAFASAAPCLEQFLFGYQSVLSA